MILNITKGSLDLKDENVVELNKFQFYAKLLKFMLDINEYKFYYNTWWYVYVLAYLFAKDINELSIKQEDRKRLIKLLMESNPNCSEKSMNVQLSNVIRELKTNGFLVQGEYAKEVMLNERMLKWKKLINNEIMSGKEIIIKQRINVKRDFSIEDIIGV